MDSHSIPPQLYRKVEDLSMDEIERIKKYISQTKVDDRRYYLHFIEARAIAKTAHTYDDVLDAVSLAFKFGQAKGYRAAKAEGRARIRER